MTDLTQLTVVLVRTRNPLNIGAVARAMQNFGAPDLRLVAPYEEAFREARSAVGAANILNEARVHATVADAVADCRFVVGTTSGRRRDLHQPLVDLNQMADPMHTAMAQGHVALLFGSEKHGLTREDMEHCHCLARIPTETEQPSMNLGQATAVCLWELARAHLPETGSSEQEPRATSADLERLVSLALTLLDDGGYMHPKTQASTESLLRQMLRRLHVTDADTHLLMGMTRKLLWKLRAPGQSTE